MNSLMESSTICDWDGHAVAHTRDSTSGMFTGATWWKIRQKEKYCLLCPYIKPTDPNFASDPITINNKLVVNSKKEKKGFTDQPTLSKTSCCLKEQANNLLLFLPYAVNTFVWEILRNFSQHCNLDSHMMNTCTFL